MSVPGAISRAELTHYGRMLHLAAAQQLLLENMYNQQYVPARLELETTILPALTYLSQQAVGTLPPGEFSPAKVEAFAAFVEAERSAIERFKKPELDLFAGLQTLLSDSQMELLPRVLAHRARARCSCNNRETPGATIDLSALIEQIVVDQEEIERLDPVLAEYEDAITEPFVALEAEIAAIRVEHLAIAARRQFQPDGSVIESGTAEDMRSKEAAVAARRKLLVKSAALERRIVQVNSQFMPRLKGLLPDGAGEQLEQAYLVTAYPGTYPDETRPKEHASSLARRLQAPTAVCEVIDSIWVRYDESYHAICDEMKKSEDAWHAKLAETKDYTGRVEHLRELDRMREARSRLTEQTLRQIIDTVPAELTEAFQGWSGLPNHNP